jgi:hypothetical protein
MSSPERQIKELLYLTTRTIAEYCKEHRIEKEEVLKEVNEAIKSVYVE